MNRTATKERASKNVLRNVQIMASGIVRVMQDIMEHECEQGVIYAGNLI